MTLEDNLVHEEDGFDDQEFLIKVAVLIKEWCDKQPKTNKKLQIHKKAYPYVKIRYPNCTYSKFERSFHEFFPELAMTEFTKKRVYKKIQDAYISFPNNVSRFAKAAGITEQMASMCIHYWGFNGEKFTEDLVAKFNEHYQSYLDGEIELGEFSKKIFNNNNKGGQLILLYMQRNYLISRYHYKSCKEKTNRRELEFNITGNYINKVFKSQNGRCAVTDIEICSFYTDRNGGSNRVYSIDRIDNDVGYLPGNIRLTTKNANVCRNILTIPASNELAILQVAKLIKNNEEAKKLYDTNITDILLKEQKSYTYNCNVEENNTNEDDNLLLMSDTIPVKTDAYLTYYE